ncbi:ATP-dependent helicase [Patescibacteria group bacterium]|nr:ATP-dependent helicase [Patescibacteria group bacterium]
MKFKEVYKNLNSEQKEAVDNIEGPVMVIAGPGTGKTHLLTMRIANILKKTDTPPEAILALTFTESGVASMRKKLIGLIGSSAYQVNITTFHGFANDIIKSNPDEFPKIIGSNHITDVEQIKIIREIIDKTNFQKLKPFGDKYYYLYPIVGSINELKEEGVSPEDFEKIVKEKEEDFEKTEDLYNTSEKYKGQMKGKYVLIQNNIIKNKELAKVYSEYEKTLDESRFYDYSDMIMQVMLTLKNNPGLLIQLQEQYLYLLIDEHQDTNSAQNKILELLASYYDSPNLFIVGDEKQAIFRFQGASIENFLYFKKLYKDVKLINLKQNYRSTQTILDAADNINTSNERLLSQSKDPETSINIYPFPNLETEQHFLATSIGDLIKEGVSPERIAVLYRDNRDVIPVSRILSKFGIPFSIESNQDILNDEDIVKLITILKTVQDFGDSSALYRLLHIDIFNISPIDIYKVINYSHKKKINPYNLIKSLDLMEKAEIEDREKLRDLYVKLSDWAVNSHNKSAIESFENIVRDSGFLNYLLKRSDSIEKIEKMRILFNQIKSLIETHKNYTLVDFFDYLKVVEEHNISLSNKSSFVPERVRLMTAHRSKGLEFEYVYIINAITGHWGSRRSYSRIKLLTDPFVGDDSDDRNLFYVALTRARKKVFITYAGENQDGREQLPSKFIEEIKEEYLKKEDVAIERTEEKEFSPVLKADVREKNHLNQIFLDQGFSVTALNNYLECPWRYFYSNLIRIPQAPNKNLTFGTVIHNALKISLDKFLKEGEVKKEYLIETFVRLLLSQPIPEEEYQEMLDKGKRALSGYYDNYHLLWKPNFLLEFGVNGVELGKITLTGKLDKIEIIEGNKVNVIDYKTGKPKSRNEIEGLTKNSNGNYKRQLVFYNILLNSSKFKMQSGMIDFVEPNDKGIYKREIFEITQEEVEDLKDQIKVVADEILNLSFWDKTCENKDCPYCKLRKMM